MTQTAQKQLKAPSERACRDSRLCMNKLIGIPTHEVIEAFGASYREPPYFFWRAAEAKLEDSLVVLVPYSLGLGSQNIVPESYLELFE